MSQDPYPPSTTDAPNRGEEQNSRSIRVTNVRVIPGSGYVDITCDVSWRDSWRWSGAPAGRRRGANWDAAWLIVKYQITEATTMHALQPVVDALNEGDPRPFFAELSVKNGDRALFPRPEDRMVVNTAARSRHWMVTRERQFRGEMIESFSVRTEANATGGRDMIASKPGPWRHATITEAPSPPPNATVDVAADGTGVFLYRSTDGEGTVEYEGLTLRISDPHGQLNGEVAVWVLGVEMVYIPEGAFRLGDPQGANGPTCCLYDSAGSGDDLTYPVTSEDPIPVGDGPVPPGMSQLYYDNTFAVANPGDQQGPIPAAFPKGFQAFYLMKHQITQGDYTDFINTLTGAAWVNRTSYWYGSYRLSIFKTPDSRRYSLRPTRACNWLDWMDGAAYAAWAGLRPMTELEYEKACRGTAQPHSGEYAWGTINVIQAQVIIGPEDGTEAVSGNCNVGNMESTFIGGDGGMGPVRDDAFAAPRKPHAQEMWPPGLARFALKAEFPEVPVDLREATGASYWGVMGLSGNLWEYCVTVGDAVGRAFSGKEGDGTLDKYGNATTKLLGWPGADVEGTGGRGGSWYTVASEARIADRTMGSGLQYYTTRSHDIGFRCARTAPKPAG